jgi:hypothetical protein
LIAGLQNNGLNKLESEDVPGELFCSASFGDSEFTIQIRSTGKDVQVTYKHSDGEAKPCFIVPIVISQAFISVAASDTGAEPKFDLLGVRTAVV